MTASVSNRPSAAKRKRLSPEERRSQLLETAVDVFAEMGIERAGHGDIAKRAGVSTPTVFNYFPTRARLVEAVLAEIEGDVAEMFASVPVETPETGNVRRHRILQLATAYQNMVERKPGAAKTFLKWGVSFDPDIRPTYLAFQTRMLDFLVAYLPDNPEDPAKARAEARILYGAANLLAVMAFDNFKPEEMYDYVGRIADILSQPV